MNVSFDLIICTYNHADLLDRVLETIARQKPSGVEWGVLVINNNCSDHTATIVDKHLQAATIPNLSQIIEPQQGLNHARRCGIENTTGDWIAFIDDDCLLAVDWLEQAVRFAQQYPDCSAFGGRVSLEWSSPPKPFVREYGYCFAQQEQGRKAKTVSCLVGAGMVINRRTLLATNWLKKQCLNDRVGQKLISGGDVELALRLSAVAELWYNPLCQINHFIPAKRTQFKYLCRINYGLGISQIFGDALLWSDSELDWSLTTSKKAIAATKKVLFTAIKAMLGRGSKPKAMINACFVLGKWNGIVRISLMLPKRRGAILGCAASCSESLGIETAISTAVETRP